MSRKSRTTLSAVEKLVEQRRLFQDWLAKLDSADGMPGHVTERVRNDYRTRLAQVEAELAEHQDALRQALEEAMTRQDGLISQQARRKDELAELRLRKHVGELDDDEFRRRNSELKSTLDQLNKELHNCIRDIERFEEILDTIASREERPEEPEAAALAVAEEFPAPEPPQRRSTAKPPEPKSGGKRTAAAREQVAPPAARKPVDELDFLRSVTGVVEPVKAPAPPSAPATSSSPSDAAAPADAGQQAAPGEQRDSPAEPQAAQAGTQTERSAPPSAPDRVEVEAEPPAAPPVESEPPPVLDASAGFIHIPQDVEPAPTIPPKPARVSVETQRTLVCGACGAANLPTEWYCEKCGAELSAY